MVKNWTQHFMDWLEDEFIAGLLFFYENDRLPENWHPHPQKLLLTITTPEGQILENLEQMRSVMKHYDRQSHRLVIRIESVYVREVAGVPETPGDYDLTHIGHAVLEYRFLAEAHNRTGSLVVTAGHPNICVWGR
jgi:hypothetical protein